jgi:hypothetical protein
VHIDRLLESWSGLGAYEDGKSVINFTTASGEPLQVEIRETSGFTQVNRDRPVGRTARSA